MKLTGTFPTNELFDFIAEILYFRPSSAGSWYSALQFYEMLGRPWVMPYKATFSPPLLG